MLKSIVSTNIVTYHFLHHFITLSLIYYSTVLLLWTAGIHHTAYWGPHSTGKYKTHQFILKALFHWCVFSSINTRVTHTHTHTHRFTALFPGLPGSAGTRKVKPIWILLKQETVSGSGISWAICKSAPRSRQPHQHPTTQFLQAGCSSCRPTNSVKALNTRVNMLVIHYATYATLVTLEGKYSLESTDPCESEIRTHLRP